MHTLQRTEAHTRVPTTGTLCASRYLQHTATHCSTHYSAHDGDYGVATLSRID